jgi:hypothetical protein
MPTSMRCPPAVQFAPLGSAVNLISDERPAAPADPADPVAPVAPLQTYAVELTSLCSSVPS